MTPLPSETTAEREVTRTVMSASRISGSPSTGRSTALLPTISTASPSSGMGGPPATSVAIGAFVAISSRSTVPLTMLALTQLRTLGAK